MKLYYHVIFVVSFFSVLRFLKLTTSGISMKKHWAGRPVGFKREIRSNQSIIHPTMNPHPLPYISYVFDYSRLCENRLRNEEHSRLQAMRLQHAEDIATTSRRKAATLASINRQAELDRDDWGRRAKEEACAGGEEVMYNFPQHERNGNAVTFPQR